MDFFVEAIQKEFEVKVRGRLGSGAGDGKTVRILNRIIRWTHAGIRVEADPRHVEILTKEMGLNEANVVITPGAKAHEGNGGDTGRAARQGWGEHVPSMRRASQLLGAGSARHRLRGQGGLPGHERTNYILMGEDKEGS